MNTIRLGGQAISSTNYATKRSFNFNPEMVRAAAENFLAAGITEIEIPQGVLDPDGKNPDTGVDREKVRATVAGLPKETRVVATYLGGGTLGADNEAFLASMRKTVELLCEHFPDMKFAMLHPAGPANGTPDKIPGIVAAWAKLAEFAAKKRPGFQMGLHNHYDSSGETAEQVRAYLGEIEKAKMPALRWAPDTGHSEGMKDQYIPIFEEYAHLIGDCFHIKTRVPAFDSRHNPDLYRPDRDIWNNNAEVGRGLYGGFVNCADPEISTPLAKVFEIVRKKARPAAGAVVGMMEIDVPRQHPRLEILCAALYLKRVHGVEGAMKLDYRQIVERVFPV